MLFTLLLELILCVIFHDYGHKPLLLLLFLLILPLLYKSIMITQSEVAVVVVMK